VVSHGWSRFQLFPPPASRLSARHTRGESSAPPASRISGRHTRGESSAPGPKSLLLVVFQIKIILDHEIYSDKKIILEIELGSLFIIIIFIYKESYQYY